MATTYGDKTGVIVNVYSISVPSLYKMSILISDLCSQYNKARGCVYPPCAVKRLVKHYVTEGMSMTNREASSYKVHQG